MTTYRKSFDTYILYHYASPNAQTPIIVYCSSGTTPAGNISFYRDEGAVPQNRYDYSKIWLYYPMSQFGNVMNTLRLEKPLFMSFDSDGAFGYIATSEAEPVGEEEGAA